MSELKQIRILSFKIFDHCNLCLYNTKKFCKALVDTPIRFLIIQNGLKIEEDIGLELERSLELFFQKNWSKLSLILFPCFLHCSVIFVAQGTFVALQFAYPMTQKLLNLGLELENYWKMFGDKYVFNDKQFYRILWKFSSGHFEM